MDENTKAPEPIGELTPIIFYMELFHLGSEVFMLSLQFHDN